MNYKNSSFPFKQTTGKMTKTGGSGMGAKQQEDDLKKYVGTDTRTVGGRYKMNIGGEDVNPKFSDKMKQIERWYKEALEGGMSKEDANKEKARLIKDLKDNIAPSDTTGEDY